MLNALLPTVAIVGAVNGAVRCLGKGDTHLLSPLRLQEKTLAVGALLEHLIAHPFRPEHANVRGLVRSAARREKLPESFVLAVAEAESAFNPHRISPAGAMGLMQLMPETVEMLGVFDPFDPKESADGGARYLGVLWRKYRGDPLRTAAAYNAGPSRVPGTGPLDLPPETRAYVARVERVSRRLKAHEAKRASR